MIFTDSDLYEGLEELEENDPLFTAETKEKLEELDEAVEALNGQFREKDSEYRALCEEAKEQSKPFFPDKIDGGEELFKEIVSIEEKASNLESQRGELVGEVSDRLLNQRIEGVRDKSEYWADRFTETKERIEHDEQIEHEKFLRAQERGKEYIEPDPSSFSRRMRLENQVEFAQFATPDEFYEVVDDYNGMIESGWDYWEEKENLLESLDKITYEEAQSLLENGRSEGKYTDENYQYLSGVIRKHYDV